MNRIILLVMMMTVFLSGCGINGSWEDEKVSYVSHRIMADNVKTVWTLKQGQPSSAGTLIRLKITEDDGHPIDKFDVTHEKLLHLIAISKDLSYFNHIHIHPKYKGNGMGTYQRQTSKSNSDCA